MSEKEVRLALWMRQRYFCTFYDALHTILPAAVWYRYREMWRLARDVLPETLPERRRRYAASYWMGRWKRKL